MNTEQKLEHMCALKSEIEYLRTRLRPHDTGHIHTTINTLEARVKTLYREVYSREARVQDDSL
jgi:hypothetical protein